MQITYSFGGWRCIGWSRCGLLGRLSSEPIEGEVRALRPENKPGVEDPPMRKDELERSVFEG